MLLAAPTLDTDHATHAALAELTARHARLRLELRSVLARKGRRDELPLVLDALHDVRQALERRLVAPASSGHAAG